MHRDLKRMGNYKQLFDLSAVVEVESQKRQLGFAQIDACKLQDFPW